ncbi:hypothetical protein [Colwellia sp. E2M01]|uniref:hypothetical protein n=1 Tax=Colwellia sp. E2M01 TaxID=2841561 RepID=UPI001C08EC9E|nr:hypothetical protein [Colwellia sp. E2M01]MBU2869584.1 hypothetical protein [Colwellia sp. E2M01]
MKEELSILVPIIGFSGVIIGAVVQAIFNRKNQKVNNLSELQNSAYADFLNAASKIAVAQRQDQRSTVEKELSNLADAKSRICVYGDSNVVHHLAEFLREGGTLQTELEILSFTRLCMEIRKSVGMSEKELRSCDISQLLFSVDVKNTKTPGK